LERLCVIYNVNNNKQLSEKIGINYNTVSTWIKRDTIPYDVLYSLISPKNISFDWLLSGKGKMILETNSNLDNFIVSKINSLFELVAIVNPNTLDISTNNLEQYKQEINKIDLIHVYDGGMDRLFAFIFLANRKVIYIESGRMNFSGGGSSLRIFGRWLLKNNLMDKTYLNFLTECYYVVYVKNLGITTERFIELPQYTNQVSGLSIIPTCFRDWQNGYFNGKPYQDIIQRIITGTILKGKED